MQSPVQLIPFNPTYIQATAQAFLEVFTAAPWNETVSFNDILAELTSDQKRPGFDGVLLVNGTHVVGFSWWYDVTGRELNDRWRPRFLPKENVPTPTGRGVIIAELAIVPAMRNRGFGEWLVNATLEHIENDHDWIAIQVQRFAHAALALLKSNAFEELDIRGVQVPTRMAMLKTIYR